ncbi:MAG: hypothetical protein AB8I40_11625, partial [Anaerolineales bacterium]
MTLDHVRRTYEDFGDDDPFFAVLSSRDKAGGRWDPEEFFATGVREINHVFAYLDSLGIAHSTVEHEPVFTAGRATPPDELTPEIVPIERGGRITYHGPGQLVVYPIVPLPRRDVRAWLRRLEAFGVAV